MNIKRSLTIILCIIIFTCLIGCSAGCEISKNSHGATEEPQREPVVTEITIGSREEGYVEKTVLNRTFEKTEKDNHFDSGWSQTAKYTVDKNKSATNDGTGSLKFSYDYNLSGGGLTLWIAYNFDVVKGREYSVTMSYAGKSGGTYRESIHCGVSKYAANNSMITDGTYDEGMVQQWNIKWKDLTDGIFYQAPSIDFTAENTGTYTVLFVLYGLQKKGQFWIDDIKVTEKYKSQEAVVTFEALEGLDKKIYHVWQSLTIDTQPEAPEIEGCVFGGWYDENGYIFSADNPCTEDKKYCALYFPEEAYEPFKEAFNLQNEIPSVIINTANGREISSKETYINAKMTVESIHEKYNLKDINLQIRGRGNSSWWNMEKHSYKIKLETKTKLLGMHSDRNFALISNHDDKSLLRNFIAYGYGNSLESLDWTQECHFVHLTLNGDYRGLYLLVETVREDNNRINLDGTPSDPLDIGFIAEQIPSNRRNEDVAAHPEEKGKYALAGGLYWDVKYPEAEDFTSEAEFKKYREYSDKCISNAINAIKHKDYALMCEYIDIDSFIDFWLTEELFANFDCFQASIFIYKPKGGKVFLGPVWDFDISVNNISYKNISPDEWYIGKGNSLFGLALKVPEIKELCFNRIKELYEKEWKYLITMIDECALNIEDGWNRNFTRWSYDEKVFETPSWILDLPDYDAQIEYIKVWLNKHMVFLYNEAMKG